MSAFSIEFCCCQNLYLWTYYHVIYHWHDLAVDEYLTYIFGCGSDDRSADVFREKIESATQMKAVIGADPRPNCLIIDEIDGAPQVSYVE